MELRIGVVYTPKELSIDVDGTAEDVMKTVETAMAEGSGGMLWLTDAKGRRIGTPTDKIAYIEIDEEGSSKHVGFGR